MNNRNIKPISPFILFCQKVIPLAFDESMSYYECLCALTNYLHNEVTPAVNNNADAVTELQKYVANYFNNLDVQTEINNKLDEMATSGQLEEIISDYLNSKVIFGFDSVEDMKTSTNLINGSYAKTMGYYSKDDKGGATYYITNTGIANGIDRIELNNGLIAVLQRENYYLKANQVGVHADSSTDDKVNLQNIINYCKENDLELLIEGYVYVSDSIDTKGIVIKGLGKRPRVNHTYESKKYGNIGWEYLRNTGYGALITFSDYVNDNLNSGSGIISDVANPILKCNTDDGKFYLENLSIVGWLRTENQIGIKSVYTNDSDTYINGKHTFKDISVFNCGGDAINLQSLELTHVNNCDISYNFGHGIYIEGLANYDCPFEYTTFNQCRFSGNKLGGIYANNSFRKSVEFNNCLINRNGLYAQLALSLPDNFNDMVAGITIKGKNPYGSEDPSLLIVHNCHGEETNCLVKIQYNESGKIFNNISIEDCVSYPIPNMEGIGTLAYIDVYYSRPFSFFNNYIQSSTLSSLELGNVAGTNRLIPGRVDKIFYTKLNYNPNITVNPKITVTKKQCIKYDNLIFVNVIGTANDNIPAYTSIISNLPTPIDQFYTNINVEDAIYRGSIYTNGEMSSPHAITNGNKITISFVYYINYQS